LSESQNLLSRQIIAGIKRGKSDSFDRGGRDIQKCSYELRIPDLPLVDVLMGAGAGAGVCSGEK
jgi:hypothetical protein